MEAVLDIGVGILHLIPLILMFYIPALLGMATWSERGEGYRIKAILFSSASAVQMAEVVGLSLIEMAVALYLAALTVNRLAD
jgi:hypothetical protein